MPGLGLPPCWGFSPTPKFVALSTFSSTSPLKGLTDQETAARLKAYGPNHWPSAQPRSVVPIALEVVKEPMFLLLLACGTICLTVGDVQEDHASSF